ncbi:DUF2207 domain-containing protein [Ruminococcaceae bacterium OttesenSCG-928-A16]|nr:DUF2207 domain-containing protein [Ruminococcaceae bacterium OttesenSCG-928-A16]
MGNRKGVPIKAAGFLALLLILLCLFLYQPVQGANAAIRSIDIMVDLQEDGSAHVTEVWDVTIVDGTEYYLTKHNLLKGQDITNLSVTDESGRRYTNIGVWNSNREGADKFGECGLIATNGGYEICWGIYNDYGNHVYTVQYTMAGLVQRYKGGVALNQWFISKELLSYPEEISVVINKPGTTFTSNDTKVWAYGFTGDIYVENGQVVANSSKRLFSKNYVSVLAVFEGGQFSPAVSSSKTIEKVKKDAMEGSQYISPLRRVQEFAAEHGIGVILTLVGVILPITIYFLRWVKGFLTRLRKKSGRGVRSEQFGLLGKQYKKVAFCRALPWKNNVIITHTAMNELGLLKNEGTLIGAYLLHWLQNQQVKLVKKPAEGKGKEMDAIELQPIVPGMQECELELYHMLAAAAGKPDFVLEKDEFKAWAKVHHKRVGEWFAKCKKVGEKEMKEMGALAKGTKEVRTIFGKKIKHPAIVATKAGVQYAKEMMGFKKYLQNFTIINERQPREVELWEAYLVYAQVFGIADAVAEQFKQLYPAYFNQPQMHYGGAENMEVVTHLTSSYGIAMATGYNRGHYDAISRSSGSSGGGGSSSSSGGGGGTR